MSIIITIEGSPAGVREELEEFARLLGNVKAYQAPAQASGKGWQTRAQGAPQAAPAKPPREIPVYASSMELLEAVGIPGLSVRQSSSVEDGQVWLLSTVERLNDEDFTKFKEYGLKNALRFDTPGKCWVYRRKSTEAPPVGPAVPITDALGRPKA